MEQEDGLRTWIHTDYGWSLNPSATVKSEHMNSWHVARGTWHVARDTCHVQRDTCLMSTEFMNTALVKSELLEWELMKS